MYEELAQLIEQNKVAIANYIADETYDRKLTSYTDKANSEIAELVMPTVEMVARYIRTSDPTEYRNYVHALTLTRLAQGYDMDEFFSMSAILVDGVKSVLEAKLTEPEQTRQKERYSRRLQGLHALGQSAVAAASISH